MIKFINLVKSYYYSILILIIIKIFDHLYHINQINF